MIENKLHVGSLKKNNKIYQNKLFIQKFCNNILQYVLKTVRIDSIDIKIEEEFIRSKIYQPVKLLRSLTVILTFWE